MAHRPSNTRGESLSSRFGGPPFALIQVAQYLLRQPARGFLPKPIVGTHGVCVQAASTVTYSTAGNTVHTDSRLHLRRSNSNTVLLRGFSVRSSRVERCGTETFDKLLWVHSGQRQWLWYLPILPAWGPRRNQAVKYQSTVRICTRVSVFAAALILDSQRDQSARRVHATSTQIPGVAREGKVSSARGYFIWYPCGKAKGEGASISRRRADCHHNGAPAKIREIDFMN
jgi:hypothetical protein